MRNVLLQNLRGQGNQQIADLVRCDVLYTWPDAWQEGLMERPMEGIVFEDVAVGGVAGWKCNDHVRGAAINVTPPACPQLQPST